MGIWGRGNFDEDTAADHLSSIAGRLYEEVEKAMKGKPVELEPGEYWQVAVPCNLEILALFAEQRWVGAKIPDPATLAAWKHKYLAIWDAKMPGLEPSPGYTKERRAVLSATFDRLMKWSKREAGSHAPPAPKPAKKRGTKPRKAR